MLSSRGVCTVAEVPREEVQRRQRDPRRRLIVHAV
jgi:hypothetical protein